MAHMVTTAQSKAQPHRVSGAASVVPIRAQFNTSERCQRIQALVQRVEALGKARSAGRRIRRAPHSALRRPARATVKGPSNRNFRYLPEIVLAVLGLAGIVFLPVDTFSGMEDWTQLAAVFIVPFLLCAVVVGGGALWRMLWR